MTTHTHTFSVTVLSIFIKNTPTNASKHTELASLRSHDQPLMTLLLLMRICTSEI